MDTDVQNVEITMEEYDEYERLKNFFVYVQNNFYELRLRMLNLKYIACSGIGEKDNRTEWFLLNADMVASAFQFADKMYDKIADYPFLIQDTENQSYNKY